MSDDPTLAWIAERERRLASLRAVRIHAMACALANGDAAYGENSPQVLYRDKYPELLAGSARTYIDAIDAMLEGEE
jgi:hypothetical protein